MKLFTYIVAIALCSLPLSTYAATFATSGRIAPDEAVTDDLYAIGELIEIGTSIAGDAFLAANKVSVSSLVEGDIFAAGDTVRLLSDIGDDVFAVGSIVEIDAPTVGDVFAAGATVKIFSNTTVTGDVYLAGDSLTIGGEIQGTVRASASHIQILDNTAITGDLITYGANEPQLGQNVSIQGDRRHERDNSYTPSARSLVLDWVLSVLVVFAGSAALLYLLPAVSRATLRNIVAKPITALGVGVVWSLLLIPASISLALSVLGIPIAIMLIILTLLLSFVSWFTTALVIGERALSWLSKNKELQEIQWQHALLGAVLLQTLVIVPLIGWLVLGILFATTFGALVRTGWYAARSSAE